MKWYLAFWRVVMAQPLSNLNASSANVAKFIVRVHAADATSYEHKSKFTAKMVKGHRFECDLVGVPETTYCRGFVRGTEAMIRGASEKFLSGTV